MAFKLTFSKTAVDDFFNGAVGARFKIEHGRGFICPTNQFDEDVIEFVSRNRGGMELSFLDAAFSEAQNILDGGEMVFFTLQETATDWLEMTPFTEAGAPEKFKPVARFWNLDRKSSYIPVAEREDMLEVRRPVGRPRKVIEEVSAGEAVKRGPGRPKKVVEEIRVSAEETPVKRGPGRPKKTIDEQPSAVVQAVPTTEASQPGAFRNEVSVFSEAALAIREAFRLTEQVTGAGRPSREIVAARHLLEVVRDVADRTLPARVTTQLPPSNEQSASPQFAVMMIYPVGIAVPTAEDIKPVLDVFTKNLGAAFSGQGTAEHKELTPEPVTASPTVKNAAVIAAPVSDETTNKPEVEMADGGSSVPELVYVPETDIDLSTLEENATRAAKLWKQGRRSGGNDRQTESAPVGALPKRTHTRTIVVEDRRRQRQMV